MMALGDPSLQEHFFNPIITARIATAIAITALLSLITLGLLYAGNPVFGPINDLTNATGGLLNALLAWQLLSP